MALTRAFALSFRDDIKILLWTGRKSVVVCPPQALTPEEKSHTLQSSWLSVAFIFMVINAIHEEHWIW